MVETSIKQFAGNSKPYIMRAPYTIRPEVADYFSGDRKLAKDDMQGLIARGYDSLNASRYILLQIADADLAKKYYKDLADNYISRADKSNEPELTENRDPKRAVHLAFTHHGLKQLGLPEAVRATFSRPFIEGMSYPFSDPDNPGNPGDPSGIISERSTVLGDTGRSAPANWYWGYGKYYVDCVLLLYAENRAALDILLHEVYTGKATGLKLVRECEDFEYDENKLSREHFGFSDGISQPIIKGFSKSKVETSEEKLIEPGEFILGYKNEYGHYSPSPYITNPPPGTGLSLVPEAPEVPECKDRYDLGKNGTYLVFRQMEQHVEEFWRFHYHHSKEDAVSQTEKAVRLGAKMIGRWPDGQPLVTCPSGVCGPDTGSLNEFMYYQQDKDGVNCPLGAHIRRTNPRDQVHTGRNAAESLIMSRRHRMLRRGRIYGVPLVPDMDIEKMICLSKDKPSPAGAHPPDKKTPIVRGLHFICLVSD